MEHIDNQMRSWDNAWASEGVNSWYPDEQVVRFMAANFVRRVGVAGAELSYKNLGSELRGLDLGCGNGRHMITMSEMGINAYGVDLSKIAVDTANDWLAFRNFPQNAMTSSLTKLPFSDNYFDLGICHGVLDHMLAETRLASLVEIRRVMKPGAKLFLSLISVNDSACGSGNQLDHMTWEVEEGFEKGIPQAFFDMEELGKCLEDFVILSIVEVSNNTIFGRSLIGTDKHYTCDSRYYVSVECR